MVEGGTPHKFARPLIAIFRCAHNSLILRATASFAFMLSPRLDISQIHCNSICDISYGMYPKSKACAIMYGIYPMDEGMTIKKRLLCRPQWSAERGGRWALAEVRNRPKNAVQFQTHFNNRFHSRFEICKDYWISCSRRWSRSESNTWKMFWNGLKTRQNACFKSEKL